MPWPMKVPRTTELSALAAMVFVGIGCASPRPSYESLDWNVGPGFDRVYQARPDVSGVRTARDWESYYVKSGETVDNWTVRAGSVLEDIGSTAEGFHWQPESVMAYIKANQNGRRCATDDWSVLQQDATSILFEWKNIACGAHPEQQQVTRIVMGRRRLWIIWYGIRNTALSPDEHTVLIENLLTARVMSGEYRSRMSWIARRMAPI